MPPKHEDAKLILQLYDLRREKTLREARKWFAEEFHPANAEDYLTTLKSDHSAYLRMLSSYWDMACALVLQGAIDIEMFNATNGEHVFLFAKIQPFLPELRKSFPTLLANVEKVVLAHPHANAIIERVNANQKQMAAVAKGH